jgi:hypothetical protein
MSGDHDFAALRERHKPSDGHTYTMRGRRADLLGLLIVAECGFSGAGLDTPITLGHKSSWLLRMFDAYVEDVRLYLRGERHETRNHIFSNSVIGPNTDRVYDQKHADEVARGWWSTPDCVKFHDVQLRDVGLYRRLIVEYVDRPYGDYRRAIREAVGACVKADAIREAQK